MSENGGYYIRPPKKVKGGWPRWFIRLTRLTLVYKATRYGVDYLKVGVHRIFTVWPAGSDQTALNPMFWSGLVCSLEKNCAGPWNYCCDNLYQQLRFSFSSFLFFFFFFFFFFFWRTHTTSSLVVSWGWEYWLTEDRRQIPTFATEIGGCPVQMYFRFWLIYYSLAMDRVPFDIATFAFINLLLGNVIQGSICHKMAGAGHAEIQANLILERLGESEARVWTRLQWIRSELNPMDHTRGQVSRKRMSHGCRSKRDDDRPKNCTTGAVIE